MSVIKRAAHRLIDRFWNLALVLSITASASPPEMISSQRILMKDVTSSSEVRLIAIEFWGSISKSFMLKLRSKPNPVQQQSKKRCRCRPRLLMGGHAFSSGRKQWAKIARF